MDKLQIEVKNLEYLIDKSYYNHNYYRHKQYGYVIYEVCNEFSGESEYYKTDADCIAMEYLGAHKDSDWENGEWLVINYQQR